MHQFVNPTTDQTYLLVEQDINGIAYLLHGLAGQPLHTDPYDAQDRAEVIADKTAELTACGWIHIQG